MNLVIPLTAIDLAISALLVLLLAGVTIIQQLQLAKILIISAVRAFLQLLLLGYILNIIFELQEVTWILAITIVMLLVAGYEVMSRQHRKLKGWWGFGTGTVSLFISSFCVMLITLTSIINIDPWYEPQYLIPIMGMLLGNTMTGIAVSMDRLLEDTWVQRGMIETRLCLGHTASEAISDLRRKALRSGLIPRLIPWQLRALSVCQA